MSLDQGNKLLQRLMKHYSVIESFFTSHFGQRFELFLINCCTHRCVLYVSPQSAANKVCLFTCLPILCKINATFYQQSQRYSPALRLLVDCGKAKGKSVSTIFGVQNSESVTTHNFSTINIRIHRLGSIRHLIPQLNVKQRNELT